MTTLWAHEITNIGDGELTTMFGTIELFDRQYTHSCEEDV